MARAKINFFPKASKTGYCLDKISIVEKCYKWTYDTSDFQELGYILTNEETSIPVINASYWIKIKAISGYKITRCYKTNSGDTSNKGEFSIDSNGIVMIYPWETGTDITMNNYLHIEVSEDTEIKYSVTQNLKNCSSDAKGSYNKNENTTITLKCNTGYYFDSIPTLKMGEISHNFIISDDNKTATININVINDITISAISARYFNVILALNHATSNIVDKVGKGERTFIISAENGYCFIDAIEVTVNYLTDEYTNFYDNDTKCAFTLDVHTDVYISANGTKKTEKLSKFANIYVVNTSILDRLSEVRFYRDVETQYTSSFDYGQYITSLYSIPFPISDDLIADSTNIMLGFKNTQVKAPILKTYKFSVNMGKIHVPEKYHNTYDYRDTICLLHLPYCETMQIETHYIINHTIEIEYKLDLYSGECVVNISSDFVNEIIASKTFTIGTQIPFMQIQTGGISNNLRQILDNGVYTPFVEVIRSIPYNINTLFGRETLDYGKLDNYRGYIKVSDIMLNISAKNDEKEEILDLLKSGVFINEKNN